MVSRARNLNKKFILRIKNVHKRKRISDKQKEQLKKALAAGEHLSLHLSHSDLVGYDQISVTQSQLSRLKKAHETGKGVIIKMSKIQVARNMKIEGGFLSVLAGLAS